MDPESVRKPPPRRARDISPRARPIQPRGARTREAVLDAAHAILKAEGLEGLSTQAVADRLGVSIGTVYRLFPNREAIVCTLYEEKLARIRELAEASRLEIDVSGDWRAGFSAYVEAIKAAERTVDFDQSLANAILVMPEIWRIDIVHALDMADRIVDVLRRLGSPWSDAALFDLAMSLYTLDAAYWVYARIAGEAGPTIISRLTTASVALMEPALSGTPEPSDLHMRRDELRKRFGADRTS